MSVISIFSRRRFDNTIGSVGVRHWELAKILSDEKFNVNIICNGFDDSEMSYPGIEFYNCEKDSGVIEKVVTRSDVVIVDSLQRLSEYPVVTYKPLVADIPYPPPYETLEAPDALINYDNCLEELKSKLVYCDLLVCSNPRQMRMWEGAMLVLNRFNLVNYERDRLFEKRIKVVPFGCPVTPFPDVKGRIKGVMPGIEKNDVVGIWNGSMHNWFDPMLVIEAAARIYKDYPHLKLVFPSPESYPGRAAHPIGKAVVDLAKARSVLNTCVFFLDKWVAYPEWLGYLADADFGVFAQKKIAETYFASRIRTLDLLWRGIPIIQTRGDYYGEIIEKNDYGLLTKPEDVESMEQALIKALDGVWRAARKESIFRDISDYTWDKAVEPLVEYCKNPETASDKRQWNDLPSDQSVSYIDAIDVSYVERVVIFGTGRGSESAVDLAERCGWDVAYFVDNASNRWNRLFKGCEIKGPQALEKRDFDLVVIASHTFGSAIAEQLEGMEFKHRTDYIFFFDTVKLLRIGRL